MSELSNIINTHFRCCEGFAKSVEIEKEYSYFEAENIQDPFFNSVYVYNDLDLSLITEFSNRLIEAKRKPSLIIENKVENFESAKKQDFEPSESTVWMELDFSQTIEFKKSEKIDLTIEKQELPYSKEFVETFIKCYCDNSDDIGYQYDSTFADAYHKARPAKGIVENVYLLKNENETVAIAQASLDIENGTSFLYNVGTIKEYRKLGYSRYLVNHVLDETKKAGVSKMYLATEEDSPMEKYYDDLGFRTVGSTINFVKN